MFNLKPVQTVTTQETLDELWAKAEQLGKVSVEHQIISNDYRAEIAFTTRRGSRVYARATSHLVHDALSSAIKEAINLGAVALI